MPRDNHRNPARSRCTPDPPHPAPPATPPIRVQDPGELVATVPALIGFHPRDSLVMIATGGRTGRRIGLTLRVDLPPPQHRDDVAVDAVRGLLLDRPAGAAVIIIGGRAGAGGPPHVELAAALVVELGRHDVEAHTVIWAESTAAGAPWLCYDPCGCAGLLPDPASTVIAAAVVAEGQVIHDDRAALERLVAPADSDRIRRRERLLVTALDEAARRPDAVGPPEAALALVDAAIAATADGEAELDDRMVVELACALGDLHVRDAALSRNLGGTAAAAEQLWTALVRELPDPEAAEPAVLLAVSALLRGDGALANVALQRAEQAWPGHRLGRLLRCAADAGVRPDQVREWLTGDPTGRPGAAAPSGRNGANRSRPLPARRAR